jgi:proteic killer suppression protein
MRWTNERDSYDKLDFIRVYINMIHSFKNTETAAIFSGKYIKGLPADVFKIAARKLKAIDAAIQLEDLKSPPGNKLEPLKDSRDGQHSIRVNDKWRLCFVWENGHAYDVEFCDYHDERRGKK